MKSLIYLLLILFVSGCSFQKKEMTPAEKQQRIEVAKSINATVVTPLYLLVRESCKYNMAHGRWPEINEGVNSVGNFESFKVVSSQSEEFKLNFIMKTVKGVTKLSVFKLDEEQFEYPYSFKVFSRFPGGDIAFQQQFSCANEGLSESELMGHSLNLTSTLHFYNGIHESRLKKQEETIATQGLEFVGKVAMCILLKLDSASCK